MLEIIGDRISIFPQEESSESFEVVCKTEVAMGSCQRVFLCLDLTLPVTSEEPEQAENLRQGLRWFLKLKCEVPVKQQSGKCS